MKLKKHLLIPTAIFISLTPSAFCAVLITWEQDGDDVVAILSGSLDTSGWIPIASVNPTIDTIPDPPILYGNSAEFTSSTVSLAEDKESTLYVMADPEVDLIATINLPIGAQSSLYSGTTLITQDGENLLFFDGPSGEELSGTARFLNTTLTDVGADGFATPTLAITLPGNPDNTISYLTVPEPGPFLLIAFASLAFTILRRR